jgi:hypothetical protein
MKFLACAPLLLVSLLCWRAASGAEDRPLSAAEEQAAFQLPEGFVAEMVG